MSKRKARAGNAGPPATGESDALASPEHPEPAADAAVPAAEPLGKLWTWTPDAPVAEVPLSARVAEVIREVEVAAPVSPTDGAPIGRLWTWTPDAAPVAPATPAPPPPPVEPVAAAVAPPPPLPTAPVFQPAEVAPAPPVPAPAKVKVRRERRSRRSPKPPAEVVEEQRETVPAAPPPPLPAAPVFQPAEVAPAPAVPAPPKVKVRRERRSRRTPEPQPAVVVEELPQFVPEAELTTLRPVFSLDPALVLPTPSPLAAPVLLEQADEPWTHVLQPKSRVPRGVRIAGVVAVLATCAALPFAVPQIPDLFAEAVPEQSSTPAVVDPSIAPPKPIPSGGVKINKSLAGRQLRSAGTPLEVIVPRLQVKSAVVPISGATGVLIPPDDAQILGWWQEGTGVGTATGSAVITGHTVNAGGGAFDHLGELVPGDELSVRTAKGTIDYIVREAQDLSVADLAKSAESIFQQTGDGRLVLITCSDFNGKVYLSNAVVYASPLLDRPKARN